LNKNIDSSQGFLKYYWLELKKLLSPATPLLVCAIYSFVLIFPRYHYAMFRTSFLEPQYRFPEKMAIDGLWFMLIPILAVLILRLLSSVFPKTKEPFPQYRFRDYGFKIGRWKGWRDTLIFFAFMLALVIAVTVLPLPFLKGVQKNFISTYPLFSSAGKSLNLFLLWEAALLIHMFGWEFINRGFLLFGLEGKMGNWAILATAIPFALLHVGKPEFEAYGSFIAAIALGWLALRTRSFLPGVLLHWGVALSMDIMGIISKGGFG